MKNLQYIMTQLTGKGHALLLQLALIVTIGIVCGCQSSKIAPDAEVPFRSTTFSFDQDVYPSELDLFPKYLISAGDILDVLFQIKRTEVEHFPITLYHNVVVKFVDLPQLNEEQPVLPDGTIMLPYLGSVYVLGQSPAELTENLKKAYSKILRSPELYVLIPNFNARIEQIRHDLHTSPRGLSKLVTVRPDGLATFPLVGEHLVAQKTIIQVNEELQELYSEYLPGMDIDLFLHEQSGSVVYLAGEVTRPGAYEMRKPITLLQAMALASGYTHEAELTNVIVFRQHEKKRIARSLNLKDLTKTNRDAKFFFLKPDDLVFVPRRKIATLAQLMSEISSIAMFRGWSVSYSLGESVDFVRDDD